MKADGLAAGKGVTVAPNVEPRRGGRGAPGRQARSATPADGGRRGALAGPEVCLLALTDGAGEGAAAGPGPQAARRRRPGPNTGGMGAYSPACLSPEAATDVLDRVLGPRGRAGLPRRAFRRDDAHAVGPKVLEFNCRFGDPETQVLVPRMPFRVGTLLHACATGRLAFEAGHAGFDEGAAVTVVSRAGVSGQLRTGLPISNVDAAESIDGVTVFHAGTARDAEGRLVTAAGRVLAVTGTGASLADACNRAYAVSTRSISTGCTSGPTSPPGPPRRRISDDDLLGRCARGVAVGAADHAASRLILEKFDIPHEVRISRRSATRTWSTGMLGPRSSEAWKVDLFDRVVGPPRSGGRRADGAAGDRYSIRDVTADGRERGARDHGSDAGRGSRSRRSASTRP